MINSKGLMLSVAPFVGLSLFWKIFSKEKGSFIVLSFALLGAFTQVLFSLYYIVTAGTTSSSNKNLLLALEKSFYGFISIPFFGVFYFIPNISLWLLIFFIFPYFYLCFQFLRKRRYAFPLLFLLLSGFTNLFLTTYLAPFEIKVRDGEQINRIVMFRQFFLSYQAVLISYFLFFDYFRRKNPWVYYFAILLLGIRSYHFIQIPIFEHPNPPWNWKRDYHLIFRETYKFPVPPGGEHWYLEKR